MDVTQGSRGKHRKASAAAPPVSAGAGVPPGGTGRSGKHRSAPSKVSLPTYARLMNARPRSFLRELPILLLVAVVLAVLIKTFLVQAFYIPSGSMEQTLLVGDRVVVNKLVYRFRDVHRGDVVVFNGLDSFVQDADVQTAAPPSNPLERVARGVRDLIGFGDPGEKDFIKRVIGVPGDVVACCKNGHVTVNGKPLDETGYLFEDDAEKFGPVKVAPGKIWVMGDHRSDSMDSRRNGQVPIDRVLGRAIVVVWPVSRAKGLRTPAIFENRPPAKAARVATSPLAVAGAVTVLGNGVRRRRIRTRQRTPRGGLGGR